MHSDSAIVHAVFSILSTQNVDIFKTFYIIIFLKNFSVSRDKGGGRKREIPESFNNSEKLANPA
jgi:hypothetical protein